MLRRVDRKQVVSKQLIDLNSCGGPLYVTLNIENL
jgi:hypothetical protein